MAHQEAVSSRYTDGICSCIVHSRELVVEAVCTYSTYDLSTMCGSCVVGAGVVGALWRRLRQMEMMLQVVVVVVAVTVTDVHVHVHVYWNKVRMMYHSQ